MDDPLYRDEILDHYDSSPHRGCLEHPDRVCDLDNPFCGDRIHVELALGDDDRIERIRFEGKGCVISQASASLVAEHLEGARITEALELGPADVVKLLGIPLTPNRMKCGLLGWRAIRQALQQAPTT